MPWRNKRKEIDTGVTLTQTSIPGVYFRAIDRHQGVYVTEDNDPIGTCFKCEEAIHRWGYRKVPDKNETFMACPFCEEGIRRAHEDDTLCQELADWRERTHFDLVKTPMTIAEWYREYIWNMDDALREEYRASLRRGFRDGMVPERVRLGLYAPIRKGEYVWITMK